MSTSQIDEIQLRKRRISFPKGVSIRPRDGTSVTRAHIFDLSLGGMFLSTYLPLEVGEVVDYEMQIARMRFRGTGRVVWTRSKATEDGQPVGAAIEFLNLTPNQKRLLYLEIADYLKSGGKLKAGRPPQRSVAERPAAARRDTTSPAPRHGLLRRFTSMLGH